MQEYTGKEYLQIDIANYIDDGDKKLFEERIQWVNDNEHRLEKLEDTADDFFRYAAAVKAYREAQAGKPIGHLVGLDACASGPALLSAMLGCKVGAANTGVTGNARMDVYGVCTYTMNELLEGLNEYDRKVVKTAFMCYFYGSKQEPKNAFGEDTPELEAFLRATSIVCPGASMFLELVLTLWDEDTLSYTWTLPDGFTVLCPVKDTINSKIEVDTLEGHPTLTYRHTVNTTLEYGLFLPANIVHSVDAYIVRELTAQCDHNKAMLCNAEIQLIQRLQRNIEVTTPVMRIEQLWASSGCLSIEGVEYAQSAWAVNQMSKEYCTELLSLVRKVLKQPVFKVITVHDEFKCHPNYMNYVRQTYIDLLAELAESTLMQHILSSVAGYDMEIEKLSDDLADDIRNAEYPLS